MIDPSVQQMCTHESVEWQEHKYINAPPSVKRQSPSHPDGERIHVRRKPLEPHTLTLILTDEPQKRTCNNSRHETFSLVVLVMFEWKDCLIFSTLLSKHWLVCPLWADRQLMEQWQKVGHKGVVLPHWINCILNPCSHMSKPFLSQPLLSFPYSLTNQ